MILQATLVILTVLCTSTIGVPVPPSPTDCSMDTVPMMSDVKIISCIVEKEIMSFLENTDLPTYVTDQERQYCNCQDKTDRFKYSPFPSHTITPHIRIDHTYKSYQPYRYPENTVDVNGNAFPVTTEWILKDYINSLKAFVDYFVSSQLTDPILLGIAEDLNNNVLSRFNSSAFSSGCPANNTTIANFSNLSSNQCEQKCAIWHFNDTVNGFNNALANQVIYKTKTNTNKLPGIITWTGIECCPLLAEEYTVTPLEYRRLTCNVQNLFYDAHTLIHQLGISDSTVCDNATTVTGIKTWSSYNKGSFPPLEYCGYDEKLYLYANHFNGLQKYNNDLSLLITDNIFNCFPPTIHNILLSIKNTLNTVLPMALHWMKGHGCPGCSSSCSIPDNVQAASSNTIYLNQSCTNMYNEVSCMGNDMHKVATSLNMFLELRNEAKESWQHDCI